MNCFFRLLLCALALVSLVCPALAADAPTDDAPAPSPSPVTVETSEGEKDIMVNVTVVNEAAPAAGDTEPDASASVEDMPVESPRNDALVLRTADAPAQADRSPLMEAVSGLLGEYQPRTCTVSTHLPDGSVVETVELVPGLAGLDYTWLAGFGLFALSLYCVFRMIGGVLTWK